MLRFKVLASSVPLLIAAAFAGGDWASSTRPCIASSDGPVQLAIMPWQADLHVAFTTDPEAATVHVQIADTVDAADFVVVDDADTSASSGCEISAASHLVAIAGTPSPTDPVIYLSANGPADLKIFVQSRTLTAREAAALLVAASRSHKRLAAAL